jgi:hypothetical protein
MPAALPDEWLPAAPPRAVHAATAACQQNALSVDKKWRDVHPVHGNIPENDVYVIRVFAL